MKNAEDHLNDGLLVIIDGGDFAYEAALKAVIEAQRDALEAAAEYFDDWEMGWKISEAIRAMKPLEYPLCLKCGSRQVKKYHHINKSPVGCLNASCDNYVGRAK